MANLSAHYSSLFILFAAGCMGSQVNPTEGQATASSFSYVVPSCDVCSALGECFDGSVSVTCSGTQCLINTNGKFVGITDKCKTAMLASLAEDTSSTISCQPPPKAEIPKCYGSPAVAIAGHPAATSGAVAWTSLNSATTVHINRMELWEMLSSGYAKKLSEGVTWWQTFQSSDTKLFGAMLGTESDPTKIAGSVSSGWDLTVPPTGQIIHFGSDAKLLDSNALYSFALTQFSGANVKIQVVTDRRQDINDTTSPTTPCYQDSVRPNCEFSESDWACTSGTVHTADTNGDCGFAVQAAPNSTGIVAAPTAVTGTFTNVIPSVNVVGHSFDLSWSASQTPINLKLVKGNQQQVDIAPSASLSAVGTYSGVSVYSDWIPSVTILLLVNGVQTDSRTITVSEAATTGVAPVSSGNWQFSGTWNTWPGGNIQVYRKNASVFNLVYTAPSGPSFSFPLGYGQFSSTDVLTVASSVSGPWMCNDTGLHGALSVVDPSSRIWTGYPVSNGSGGCDVGFQ